MLRFDHAVILVWDLDAATADYHALGFNPFFGGQHAGGKTHNALIVFQDGSYLELLAPTDPELIKSVDPTNRTNFLFMFAQRGEGLGGYAFNSQDLAADTASMQANGLSVQMRPASGRARPDGVELRWRSAMLENGSMTPFFIQDDTPRNLRVTDDPEKTLQPNGVTSVGGIRIDVANLEAGVQKYQAILGVKPQNQEIDHAFFVVNNWRLTLRANPTLSEDTLAALTLTAGDVSTLDNQLTHGATIHLD